MTGNQFKAYRERLGMNQAELAQALGISPSTVARQEQMRERSISLPRVYQLALERLESTVDFDLFAAIRRSNDPIAVMNEWFDFEGRERPAEYGVVFFDGWESYTFEDKVEALRDAKKVLDRTLRRPA